MEEAGGKNTKNVIQMNTYELLRLGRCVDICWFSGICYINVALIKKANRLRIFDLVICKVYEDATQLDALKQKILVGTIGYLLDNRGR